jgi:hypothetical protein
LFFSFAANPVSQYRFSDSFSVSGKTFFPGLSDKLIRSGRPSERIFPPGFGGFIK